MNNLWPDEFCQFGSYTTIARVSTRKWATFNRRGTVSPVSHGDPSHRLRPLIGQK